MQFVELMPSPLGRVAEQKRGRERLVKCYDYFCISEYMHFLHPSSVTAYAVPPSPEGKAF